MHSFLLTRHPSHQRAARRLAGRAVWQALVYLLVAAGAVGGALPLAAAGTQPSCPFTPQPDRTIVTFSPSGLIASVGPTQHSEKVQLPVGRYKVHYYAYDTYPGRAATPAAEQSKEQWYLIVQGEGGAPLAKVGPTPDLQDGVEFAYAKGAFSQEVLLAQPAKSVVAQHVLHPADPSHAPNSVHALCVAFDRVTTPPPACPYTENDGVVVTFPQVWLRSDLSQQRAHTQSVPLALSAGTYTVKAFSFDNHSDKPGQHQPREQWRLLLRNSTTTVATSPATPDIPDDRNTAEATWTLSLPHPTTEVLAQHAAYPDTTSPNSVVPICAAFKKLPEPKKPTCTLTADPTSLVRGSTTTLSWTSAHATEAELLGIGAVPLNGQLALSPATTTMYVLEVRSDAGVARCEAVVTVSLPSAPSCTISASATTVHPNATTTLSWQSSNTTHATLTPPTISVARNGTMEVTVSTTTTYTLTVSDDFGRQASCTATVQVVPPDAPVCTMTITPSRVTAGEGTEVTLAWSSSNTTHGTISPDIGDVPPSGSRSFIPNASREYVGTFYGPGGSATCRARVEVVAPPCTRCGGGYDQPTVSLTAQPFAQPPRQEPLGYVYLTQIPYTGIKMHPFLAAAVWLVLLVVSFAIAYWLVMRGGWRKMAGFFGAGPQGGSPMPSAPTTPPTPSAPHATPSLSASISSSAATGTLGEEGRAFSLSTAHSPTPTATQGSASATAEAAGESSAVLSSVQSSDAATGEGEEALLRELEEMAHNERILISPEGLREILKRVEHHPQKARQLLREILDAAQRLYEREDGWIPLNRDRVRALLLATREVDAVRSAQEQQMDEVVAQQVEGTMEEVAQQVLEGSEVPKESQAPASISSAPAASTPEQSGEVRLLEAIVARDEQKALAIVEESKEPVRLLLAAGELLDSLVSASGGRETSAAPEALEQQVAALSPEERVAIVQALTSVVGKPYAPHAAAILAVLNAVHRKNPSNQQ